MTAGKGIVHSERTGQEARSNGAKLFGLQTWVALPKHAEEVDPAFQHVGKDDLPFIEEGGKSVRIIAGEMYGQRAPVPLAHETIYADVALAAGASLPVPATHEERAIYTVSGEIEIAGDSFGEAQLLVFRPGDEITVRAKSDARFVIVGGDHVRSDGMVDRHLAFRHPGASGIPERILVDEADEGVGAFHEVGGQTRDCVQLRVAEVMALGDGLDDTQAMPVVDD